MITTINKNELLENERKSNVYKKFKKIFSDGELLEVSNKDWIMPDFTDFISQAKEVQDKIKKTQETLRKIEVEGVSGGEAVKIIMNGDGELKKISLEETLLKETTSIIEDLIVAAHNNAKSKLKKKTSEEISKVTGGINLPPGFKLPF